MESTKGYVHDLINEIESVPNVTWDRMEREFGRTRKQLYARLLRQERKDLILRLHRNTYGTVHQREIVSQSNRRIADLPRDWHGRWISKEGE